MQTRLLAALVGGLLGVIVAPTINGIMGLAPLVSFVGCGFAGAAVGCAISLFIDVFTSSSAEDS